MLLRCHLRKKKKKKKNGENLPNLEVVEVVLIQCNLVGNQYQQKCEVLYALTPNKSFELLLNIEPSNLKLVTAIVTFTDKTGETIRNRKQS